MTTEQFTQLQTSLNFVVLRTLLKLGCQRYNICNGEESHYTLGTETFCRSSVLFASGHVAREKAAGFPWMQLYRQANLIRRCFSVSPPVQSTSPVH